ncbi:unnamed protein product [Arctogadus glacialis]
MVDGTDKERHAGVHGGERWSVYLNVLVGLGNSLRFQPLLMSSILLASRHSTSTSSTYTTFSTYTTTVPTSFSTSSTSSTSHPSSPPAGLHPAVGEERALGSDTWFP